MFKNKKILITGASSGLGRNMAINFAKNQGKIINLSRSINKMLKLNNELNNINNLDNIYYSVDISKYDQILKINNELKQTNNLPDIIINNAAGNFLCPFEKISNNGWNRIIDIVLNGSFNIYHIFGKELINQNKSAVFLNIGTTYSNTGSVFVSPSAAAKSGVDTLMKSLTVEWSKYNMRFVGISPGPMKDTGGISKLDPLNLYSIYNKFNNPSKRMANLDEISELAMFLTSNKADYINGEIIRIDGGELNKNSGQFNNFINFRYLL
jgi:2,4-dienoyl-CoA reductase